MYISVVKSPLLLCVIVARHLPRLGVNKLLVFLVRVPGILVPRLLTRLPGVELLHDVEAERPRGKGRKREIQKGRSQRGFRREDETVTWRLILGEIRLSDSLGNFLRRSQARSSDSKIVRDS